MSQAYESSHQGQPSAPVRKYHPHLPQVTQHDQPSHQVAHDKPDGPKCGYRSLDIKIGKPALQSFATFAQCAMKCDPDSKKGLACHKTCSDKFQLSLMSNGTVTPTSIGF